jgi:prevent-host-death family protein
MKAIKASEFKAKCLSLMDEVARTGEEIVITKNGVAISKLVPCRPVVDSLFGAHQGGLLAHDDLIESVAEDWDASR